LSTNERLDCCCEDGGSTLLQNNGNYLPVDTVLHKRLVEFSGRTVAFLCSLRILLSFESGTGFHASVCFDAVCVFGP
jgi:hypothetical protein